MFTGLVEESAEVLAVQPLKVLARSDKFSTQKIELGASIAVNGVCLTVIEKLPKPEGLILSFDVSPETFSRTSLGSVKKGDTVHLEGALRADGIFGGHMVSGHVDGVAKLKNFSAEPAGGHDYLRMTFILDVQETRDLIAPFLVEKGSITVDGVSLTVNQIRDFEFSTEFDVMLIPHTIALTHLARLKAGDLVNLEADLMAKYAHRYQSYFEKTQSKDKGI